MLVVTTWLPTRQKPEVGTFVARDIATLSTDHDVHVIHLSSGGDPLPIHADGVTVTVVPMRPGDPLSIRRAAGAIRERSVGMDIVHTMAMSALLPFASMRLEIPWVHTEHWSVLLAPGSAGMLARVAVPLVHRLLAAPDVVIAVGEQLAEAIRRHRRRPTVVIANAVQRPETLHERPGAAQVTLVAVGGLIARKGPDVAVRTIAELRRRGTPSRLLWAGDGPMRDELTALARRLDVADHVELRGRVSPDGIEEFLAEGDAFLLPTTTETFGVAIAEALVAGRPVITGALGEQSSFVVEPDGVLVHEQSAEAYADGVERALMLNADRSVAEIAAGSRALFDESSRRSAYAEAYALAGAVEREADVDVVIAVHDPARSIGRAVASALSSVAVVRVIVVCHGVAADAIRTAAATADPRVEFVEFTDGLRSPAGPFNHGLDLTTARYVSIMGSDDEFTPGAVDRWRRTAARDSAQIVIAPLRHAQGARVPTPPTWRSRGLRGARDRLAYRTAPLGLIARERIDGLRMTPGLATGEDLAFSARLWFGAPGVSRHTGAGEYLIHDGDDRVTFTRRPLDEELRAVELLIRDRWALGLPVADRVALAVKLWRISLFGAVHYRGGSWDDGDRSWMAILVRDLRAYAPQALDRLSHADRALIAGLADPAIANAEIDARSRRRRRFASPAALIPSRLVLLFAREAPLRFMAATWWAGRR